MQYILIPIVIYILFSIFWHAQEREEKKLTDENNIRTRPPKAISIFFLGFAILAILALLVGIIFAILNKENAPDLITTIVLFSLIVLLAFLCFFGYAWLRFNYVVVENNDITVYRLFRKQKEYSLDEIAFFKDTTHLGIYGGLICYNKNKKKMFSVDGMQVGVSFIVRRLKEKKIVEVQSLKELKSKSN